MKGKPPKDIAASVRERLYNLARRERLDFTLVLTAYATERLLYRLSCSEYASRFILKGARLFALWARRPYRPTRDLDLLGLGESSPEALHNAITAVCRARVEQDGLLFDDATVTIEEIRTAQEYDGQRIKLTAHLAQARIPMRIDVGFGDVITPEVQMIEYTPLLAAFSAPRIRAYPRETVIAEKLQAVVALGELNTRMKDFYDIQALADDFDYDGQVLCQAFQATFRRRKTPIPSELPPCFEDAFAEDEDRKRLWRGFLSRNSIQESANRDFAVVLAKVRDFVGPPLLAAGQDAEGFRAIWSGGKGWHTPGLSR